mgnify:CR=1 FL=1
MFRDSVDAYVREDAQAARAIIPQDDALDKMNAQVSRQLIDRMARDPEQLARLYQPDVHRASPRARRRSCYQHCRGRRFTLRRPKTSATSRSPPKRRSRRLRKCAALVR